MKKLILLLGRICLSLIFVASAVSKLFSWDATLQQTTAHLAQWMSDASLPMWIGGVLTFLSGHVLALLVVGTIFEGVGGLCVLFGLKVRMGAVLLILFLLPTMVMMHPFWRMAGVEQMMQTENFMKSLSILGGLLILVAGRDDEEV